MAITGQQTINIGLPNEAANSDSLYVAFNKINNNFSNLFACASQYTTFSANTGISVSQNSNAGQVTITNTGVTSIIAGTGIVIDQATGAVTISSNGSGNGGSGTVTSVGLLPSARLTVSGSPITSSGNIGIDLANSGVTAGNYSNPSFTVDSFGRVTSAANGAPSGTVTSVAVAPGTGIQVSGSPITSNGTIIVTNTGVTRINAGSGITISGPNGNVTISSPVSGGTVTSVGINSSTLTVSGSPVVSAGSITVNLPNSISITGNLASGNLAVTGNGTFGNVSANNATFTSITGNISNAVYAVSAGTANAVTDAAQPNITSVGTLSALAVTGNISSGNISATNGAFTQVSGNGSQLSSLVGANVTGNVPNADFSTYSATVSSNAQPNITSLGTLSALTANSANVTGNLTVSGNINMATGQMVYTPVYGAFYSNVTQLNTSSGNRLSMTFNNTTAANGVSVVSGSQLTVAKAGAYNIQFSAQVTKTDAGTDYMEIWLGKNSANIAWTNTRLKLVGSGDSQLAAWNFVESANVNDYFEIFWGSADANAELIAIDSANTTMGIDVPSVIVTVTPVGA